MTDFDHSAIDELLQSRVRLAIVAYLASAGRADFSVLRDAIKTTDGNASVHLRKLEDAGYVAMDKRFVDRKPQTTYALTDRRAIIDMAAPLPRHISVPLNQISFVDVRTSTHTTGDVLFRGAVESQMSIGMIRPDGFIAIADAARVGQLLRSAIEKSINARPGRS